MSLNGIRMLQRLIGFILLVYGIYLIFGKQEFFGTLLIILAFLIFPRLNKGKSRSHSDDYVHDRSFDSALDNDNSDGGGDSDGGSSD